MIHQTIRRDMNKYVRSLVLFVIGAAAFFLPMIFPLNGADWASGMVFRILWAALFIALAIGSLFQKQEKKSRFIK